MYLNFLAYHTKTRKCQASLCVVRLMPSRTITEVITKKVSKCRCWESNHGNHNLPHGRAFKIHKQPHVGVEVEGVCVLNSGHEVPELRADKSGA
jgi:hypothetical protein